MYIPVLLKDIANIARMPTDIYVFLPLNNKYLKFLKQGLPPTKLDTLTAKNVDKVFVEYNDLKTFLAERDNFGLKESKDLSLVIPDGEEKAKNKIKEIIIKQIDTNSKMIDYSVLNYFIADALNLITPGNNSLLYYIITHLNLGKDIPHSQMVATLSVISAIYKNIPASQYVNIGLAALFHEIPLVMRTDFFTFLEQYKPGTLQQESLDFYKQMPLYSDAIRISVEYQNGERENPLSKILFNTDTIVHKGTYSSKDHILPLIST